MPRSRLDLRRALNALAFGQAGYFTASQAKEIGYSYQAQKHHVDHGNWLRVDRGLFRLPDWPTHPDDTFVRTALWSGSRGVVSHDTALQVHGLSDVDPPAIHLTVPPGFRAVDDLIVLHHAVVQDDDREERTGWSVTTPLRTLVDVASGDLSQEVVDDAIADAIDRGLVTRRRLLRRSAMEPDRVALRLERALQRLAGIIDPRLTRVTTPLTAGPGGTSPESVAALDATLRAAVESGTGPGLVMLPSPGELAATLARVTQPLDGVDVVIATSGSTDGRGHLVGLSLGALLASARATLDRLGGPGQWLATLPVHHVAGFQMVLRGALAGIPPVVPAQGESLAAAAGRMRTDAPRYGSLVPTQLARALATDAEALATLDAVLVGGAALTPSLREEAAARGVRVVATYGMTETSGGCVYDGVPLAGVEVRIVDGRVRLAGPVLATRYLDTPHQPFIHDDGARWLATADLGEWADGRLRVLGRADDVVITGSVNVTPRVVEDALGGAWVVVGVPDPEWGEIVVAVGPERRSLAEVRAVTAHLPAAARPRAVVTAEVVHRGPGKVDRREMAAIAARELAAGRGERKA